GRFRFTRSQGKSAFKELHNGACERQRVIEQTGMPRRIARPRALAAHFRELSALTPEDQTQHEPDSERREYRLCRIFTHILLCIFLECADATARISPRLFRFASRFTPGLLRFSAVFFRESACG